jgi:hypothetical protein
MTQVIINGIARGELNADMAYLYVQQIKHRANIVTWTDSALVLETHC